MKKAFLALFLTILCLSPFLAQAGMIEGVPLSFEAMGVQIYTLDNLPREYSSLSLLAVTGREFYSMVKDVSAEARKLNGNAIIILSLEEKGQDFFMFVKVIKTK